MRSNEKGTEFTHREHEVELVVFHILAELPEPAEEPVAGEPEGVRHGYCRKHFVLLRLEVQNLRFSCSKQQASSQDFMPLIVTTNIKQ